MAAVDPTLIKNQAIKVLDDHQASQEEIKNEQYHKELRRRVKMLANDTKLAHQAMAKEIALTLEEAAKKENEQKKHQAKTEARRAVRTALVIIITGSMFFLSSVAFFSAYPLWQASVLVVLTGITTKGALRYIDNEEMLGDAPYPWSPFVNLFKSFTAKSAEDRKDHWTQFKRTFFQVTGALLVGFATAKATLGEIAQSTLLPVPFPIAIAIAAAIGISNYALGAYTFAPSKNSVGKPVSLIGKMKDYWHTFKTENKWERGLRILGHGFCLAAGVALALSMTAGTGGSFFYVMAAAGVIQGIGLQRTGIPHFFVRTGAMLLRPFGIKIHTPPDAVDLAWNKAPKKAKFLVGATAAVATGLTGFFLVKAFVGISLFASIGFPPIAAGVLTAVVLGVLTYQMLQRFYFKKLKPETRLAFQSEAEKKQKEALIERIPEKKLESALSHDDNPPASPGWDASSDNILTYRLHDTFEKETQATALQEKLEELHVQKKLGSGTSDAKVVKENNPYSLTHFLNKHQAAAAQDHELRCTVS